MTAEIIVATSENHVIGLNGAIPWHIASDLARFKQMTLGHAVIMGRKTWDSLPPKFKPLPGRRNLVVTRQIDFEPIGATSISSISEAIRVADGKLFIIGGAQIYQAALPIVDTIHLTMVHTHCDGDSFFAVTDKSSWELVSYEGPFTATDCDSDPYSLLTYRRRHVI